MTDPTIRIAAVRHAPCYRTGEVSVVNLDINTDAGNAVGDRKVYQRPRLTDFGALAELTAGGSGGGQEAKSQRKKRP